MSLCAAQGTAPNEGRGGNPGTLRSALPLYGYAAAERPNTCPEGGCQDFFVRTTLREGGAVRSHAGQAPGERPLPHPACAPANTARASGAIARPGPAPQTEVPSLCRAVAGKKRVVHAWRLVSDPLRWKGDTQHYWSLAK